MQCSSCKKRIERGDRLSCINCKGSYHYRCLNITSADFQENSDQLKLTWQCQACIGITRRQRNDSTPIRNSAMSCHGFVDDSKVPLPEIDNPGGSKQSATNKDNTKISYDDFNK